MNVINFHLTNSCNYSCAYCFGKFPDKQQLTLRQAEKIVDNIYRYFKKNGIEDGRINLAGGEPLLYPHLDGLIDYINAYGIRVSLITNGSLLNEEKIAFWKGKVYCIGLSIDSALPDTNNTIGRCCNGKTLTVKQAVRITQAIHRNSIKLKINTVVSALNANEDLTGLYKRLKPDRLKLLQVETVKGINDGGTFAISKKQFNEFCKRHKNCCRDTVCEYSDDMENSYLMINPQGEFQLNDCGEYRICGNCLEEELDGILKKVSLSSEKFNSRYGKTANAVQTDDKRICIFGGHETWIKAIKGKLTNARFIKSGDLHSLDVIRNADEIWIQSNAISHSFYGKVVDAARANDIPVRYFSYAGSAKCAEQVILTKLS